MQKLITDLRQLILDCHKAGISIGQIDIDTYRIRIKVMCTRFNADHTPSTNPFDYTASVQIHNVLTHGTITSSEHPAYEVLPDLRIQIMNAVERAFDLFVEAETGGSAPYSLGETYTEEEKTKKWYQSKLSLTTQQLDLLCSFHSPNRIPRGVYRRRSAIVHIPSFCANGTQKALFNIFVPCKIAPCVIC